MPGSYIRENFFGKYPELLELVKNYSDEKLEILRRGGHDPEKVYTAYKAAVEHKGRPTVILAKTIKGYGLGETGEGRNIAHNKKKSQRTGVVGIPHAIWHSNCRRRRAERALLFAVERQPGNEVPSRTPRSARRIGTFTTNQSTDNRSTDLDDYRKNIERDYGKEMSTTMGFVRLLSRLCKDKKIGKYIVPIVPDESRTFGMDGMFREVGIYAHKGQLYDPVDSDELAYYKEAKDGQLLEEGISEAGSMSSFNAAGTAYSTHGINMIPFFIFYSMFGFQRIGDLVWAAADMRAKGFMIGGTAGRTTLNGEGLQHQDGHSLAERHRVSNRSFIRPSLRLRNRGHRV